MPKRRRLLSLNGILSILCVVMVVFIWISYSSGQTTETVPTEQQIQQQKKQAISAASPTATATAKATATPVTKIPSTFDIDVPFTSQAPLKVWDALHEDTCEEASLLMVKYFLNKEALPDVNKVDEQLKALVGWEESRGYGLSITLSQLSTVAKENYGLRGSVVTITSIDQIKRVLASGQPIIVGAAGKELKNPNFTDGGPNYHMLVIKGYDSTGFITNDPGTRNGADYHYDFNVLYGAIHDWNESDISLGKKSYLVLN